MNILIASGEIVLVDRNVFEWACSWHWLISSHGYVLAHVPNSGRRGKLVYLHQLICPVPSSFVIDHRNRNKLDNRKENLRIVTRSENAHNSGLRINNYSGFKGVYWDKETQKWRAQIRFNNKTHQLGRFIDRQSASDAILNWCEVNAHGLIR